MNISSKRVCWLLARWRDWEHSGGSRRLEGTRCSWRRGGGSCVLEGRCHNCPGKTARECGSRRRGCPLKVEMNKGGGKWWEGRWWKEDTMSVYILPWRFYSLFAFLCPTSSNMKRDNRCWKGAKSVLWWGRDNKPLPTSPPFSFTHIQLNFAITDLKGLTVSFRYCRKSGIAKMTFVIVRETVFCHWKKNLMIYLQCMSNFSP